MKIVIAAFLVAAVGIPVAASAQDVTGNSSWMAWLGCWELIQDDTRSGSSSVPVTGTVGARPSASRPTDMRVCVTQDASNVGVKMTTFAAGQVVLEQTIVADGREQPVNETGCTGSQRAEWSDHRRQLFMHAELQCKDQPRRSVSGVTLIADGPTWLDIQALGGGGEISFCACAGTDALPTSRRCHQMLQHARMLKRNGSPRRLSQSKM